MNPALIAVATTIPVVLTITAAISLTRPRPQPAPDPQWQPRVYDRDDGFTVIAVELTYTGPETDTSISRIRTLKTLDMADPDWPQHKKEATEQAQDFAALLNQQRQEQKDYL